MASVEEEISAEQSKYLSLLLEGIKLQFPSSEFKARLSKCYRKSILSWKDSDGLDLLHYTILENNLVALILFLNQGHFKPPYQPKVWPYLHLASCMGHKCMLSTIIQELQFQNKSVAVDWSIYSRKIKPKITRFTPDLIDAEKEKKHSAIDLASLFGNIDSLRLLLDFWQVNNKTYACPKSQVLKSFKSNTAKEASLYLTLACKANSPNAVRLLLTEHDDKAEALESAIRMGMPECVDVVLRDGGKDFVKNSFQGMNLFHVLFSYRTCYMKSQYESMVGIVSVLLRHDQDVNASRPSRTYPLYSFLSQEITNCPIETIIPCLIAVLLLLLNSGADPNFDEIFVEERLKDKEQNTAFGRRPYSSAVNCFLCALPSIKAPYETESLSNPADQYAYKAIELLLRHGADLSLFGKFNERGYYDDSLEKPHHEGTALHVALSTRNRSFISYPLIRLLLRYGIEADRKGKWVSSKLDYTVSFAINILPCTICTLSPSQFIDNPKLQKLSDNDFKILRYIMRFMSLSSLIGAYKEYVDMNEKLKALSQSDETISLLDDKINDAIEKAFEEHIKAPWKLQKMCSRIIWKACKMHMGNLFDLPIPNPLRNVILGFH